jgi:UDP-N-acetyl-D-mannosaminuronate dehydrogenase
LLLGLTFKENVKDTRNSRVVDTIRYLRSFGVNVIGHDPNIGKIVTLENETISNKPLSSIKKVDIVVLVNRHRQFKNLTLASLRRLMSPPLLVDLKNHFDASEARKLGFQYTAL